jgi:hypothetical protein
MATQTKKKFKPAHQQEAKSKIAATAPPTFFRENFHFIITGIFFLLSVIGILHHEMWRDELQAWMDARDAHSLSQLFQNVKYEGHPALWYMFLYVFTSVTHDPFVMQVFHILISTACIFLINRYAPFSLLSKILITFGYYTFYEYNLISRAYGLGFLLVTIFLILYANRRKHYILISLILFLLANTSIHGLMLSGFFGALLLIDYIQKIKSGAFEKVGVMKLALCCVIVASGWAASVDQIKPEADNSFPVNYPKPGEDHSDRWKFTIYKLSTSYFAIPKLDRLHFWNTSLLEPVTKSNGDELVNTEKLNLFFPVLIFLIFFFYFIRKPLVAALYTVGSVTIIYFLYYSGLTHSRYCGHLFVLLFACMWIETYYSEKKFTGNMITLSRIGKTAGNYLFILVLAAGFIGGLGAYVKDLNEPFSASKELADYLKENDLDKLKIFAASDFIVSPVAGLLDRPLYYPQRKAEGTFIIWDKNRVDDVDYGGIIKEMQEDQKHGLEKMLFITDNPLKFVNPQTQESIPITEGMVSENLHVQLLKNIKAGVVPDEKYFVYLVEEKINS